MWSSGGAILQRIRQKYPDENLPRCHFTHHKTHMNQTESEQRPLR
jgi:hypothetical protein